MGDILVARTFYGYPDKFYVGDRIEISYGGKYTATCQKVKKNGEAIFLLDQVFPKNVTRDQAIAYANFYQQGLFKASVREAIVPFKNGDILRLPYSEEIFGNLYFVEPSGKKQWELMKIAKNRIAVDLDGDSCWYWLANQHKDGAMNSPCACSTGNSAYYDADSKGIAVRPVFKLKID